MAEMLLVDSLKELRTLIDQQHLLYLELDESPRKIDQRDKLEGYIKDYLCLAPHDTKFTFHHTAKVLHQSASTKNNFSAYKAAVAWKAIGKYADNLISHPWRKEYRDIKLYCGFYKHEIEESLVNAELMFQAMGYRLVNHSSMALAGILDPDRITSVSKDAIIAFVECQIMKQIWETLSSHFNITWLEILEFRENHTGTPDQVIRALAYKHRQKQYQEQIYHRPQIQSLDNHISQSECLYGQHSLGYYNQTLYPGHSYPLSIHNKYGNVDSPQQVISPPMYPTSILPTYASSHHILKPQDIYPVNGYHVHPHYPTQMVLQQIPHNGYSFMPIIYPVTSVVPTGQLIELDSPTRNCGETYIQQSSNSEKFNFAQEDLIQHQHILKNSAPSLTSKAKDDGAGLWENWDYVYRNLEAHDYKKESESLDENQPCSSQNNSSNIDLDSIILTDFSNKLQKMNVDNNSQRRIEISSSKNRSGEGEESKSKVEKEKVKIECDKSKENEKLEIETIPYKISPKKYCSRKNTESSTSSNLCFNKEYLSLKKDYEHPSTSKEIINPKISKEETKALVVNLEDIEDKWQCITCTYLNSLSSSVCEMCYKSRERGNEVTPQPSGGAECPKCTLVNEPGLNKCAACNSSLKDSPTYI